MLAAEDRTARLQVAGRDHALTLDKSADSTFKDGVLQTVKPQWYW